MNKQLPYLVSNIVEVCTHQSCCSLFLRAVQLLDPEESGETEHDGGDDEDKPTKCAVVRTSTRQVAYAADQLLSVLTSL